MFGMIPFTRQENNLFRYLDNMEREMMSGFGDFSQFRCDIQDKGGSYLLEAELPGSSYILSYNGNQPALMALELQYMLEQGLPLVNEVKADA